MSDEVAFAPPGWPARWSCRGLSCGEKVRAEQPPPDWRARDGGLLAPNANVVQTGRTRLDGVRRRSLTLSLGFGSSAAAARSAARASLAAGFGSLRRRNAAGWHRYPSARRQRPA
jgi:Glucodextranase, domain N